MLRIEKAAVLGAGTMGAAIAAHFANAGIPTLLLDIAPQGEADKNKIVRAGFENLKKARPAAYMNNDNASLIQIGNFEDDLAKIKDCDFVIEAVVENLELKKKLYAQVEQYKKPGAVIASNTSGIPITSIADGFSDEFRRNFLGVHFFNPPRYMNLVETIPTEWTDETVLSGVQEFLDARLGKGVVPAKDRPNFIANRIGVFSMMTTMHEMERTGLTPTEIDQITGKAIGHAGSATFRTSDLVGLDITAHVVGNLYPAIPDDEDREIFKSPAIMTQMMERKLLGDKTKGGFFKADKSSGKTEILELDFQTFEYKPQAKTKFASLEAAKQIEDIPTRVKTLVWGKDNVGEFLWNTTSRISRYAANRIPEIADTIIEIDNAIKWGFGWEIGVFETWDAIGVKESVERMRAENQLIPANVEKMLESGATSFYKEENGQRSFFDFTTNAYKPIQDTLGVIVLKSIKDRTGVVKKNSGASLIDIGDGVACLEFHTKMNAIGGDIMAMMKFAVEETERNFNGLVIGNQGGNFSAGANLMQLLLGAQEEEWEEIDLQIRQFQNANMRLRYSSKPVVVAPHGLTLGGGCEITLHSDKARAAGETYLGLVEVGVGLIPGGGGTKEMTLRAMDAARRAPDADPFAFIKKTFELLGMGKVSASAQEAQTWGILRPSDAISMNKLRQIADAKADVLALSATGYTKPTTRTDILALGEPALATLKLGLFMMKRGGFVSDHDVIVGTKLGKVLCGGDLNHQTTVSEQHLLDLEREAFLSLCGMPKTQERIAFMLKNGKPLRN